MQTVCPPARRLGQHVVSALPATVDLCIYAPDGFQALFQFRDELDNPIDMTGDWLAEVRDRDGTLVTTFTVDDTGEAVGNVVLSLTALQAATVLGALRYYDLHWTPLTGEPRTWIRGAISATPGVSA